jgi:hypothetical protein
MIRAKTESSADVVRWIENEAASLWPALLGSLSFRLRGESATTKWRPTAIPFDMSMRSLCVPEALAAPDAVDRPSPMRK